MLLKASSSDNLEIVKYLIEVEKINVNSKDRYDCMALIKACYGKNSKIAKYLIDKGADIKAQDWYGCTPLSGAIDTRNISLLKNLINLIVKDECNKMNNNKSNKVDNNESNGHDIREIIKGIINEKNKDGQTLIFTAISKGERGIINYLIEN